MLLICISECCNLTISACVVQYYYKYLYIVLTCPQNLLYQAVRKNINQVEDNVFNLSLLSIKFHDVTYELFHGPAYLLVVVCILVGVSTTISDKDV